MLKKSKSIGIDWQMWGISYFGGRKRQVLERVSNRLRLARRNGERAFWIATVNPEFVMGALTDVEFKKLLQKTTDMNVVDGIGLVWAREVGRRNDKNCWGRCWRGVRVGVGVLRGKYKNEVMAGSSLLDDFCNLAKKRNYRVFFLGGWGNRAERTARFFEEKYQGLETTWSSGEPEVKNDQVLAEINKFSPDFLLVAYGMKKQEEWIKKNLTKLKAGVVMGVGRSFDYYSGDLKRAPKAWRKIGLEWLYSLIKEPKRWKRQLVLPKFVWKVIKQGI